MGAKLRKKKIKVQTGRKERDATPSTLDRKDDTNKKNKLKTKINMISQKMGNKLGEIILCPII